MLTTPMTTTNQYGSETDDVFIHVKLSQSPSDGFVGLPPPPPPPPPPLPVFNNNNMINNCKILLPHQEVNLIINRANMTEIPARSIPSIFMSSNNIWTRRILSNLRIKQNIFDQHFSDSESIMTGRYRRASVSTSPIGGGGGGGIGGINDDGPLSYVLLDATSKMLYDVPMRHLLQLVKKDYDDDASIDHVIQAIDETHMKSEWLDAVTALNKQFDKRPEDKARVLAHKGSTHGLVLIEQFFVKLVRVPAYEFKLIYLKFREEAPTQLERMSKHINDLLESIEIILNNEQLPGILHLLCLLYNSITGKTIPGIHFDSLLSVLSTRTLKQNTTIAHLLCHLLEEQYPTLLNIFDNQILLKLKDFSGIKYIPIYIDIRLLYTRYKQLNSSLNKFESEFIFVPEHIKTTLNDLQILFTKLFDNENQVKQGEKDLSTYFCIWDLSLEICLSTLGQVIDKLRLSHMQNLEQRRRNLLLTKQQRTIQTPTRSPRDTNIFRDHLNVPLTPITPRQRYKINRVCRDRYASSRDVANDEQQEQNTQNLLSNAIPRKRGHSPTAKNVLTKRPFNVLEACTTNKQHEEANDAFIPTPAANEHEDTKMDYSTNEFAIVPTINAISTCENQPSSHVSTPILQLVGFSNDQSIPTDKILIPIQYNNDLPIKIDEYEQLECADNIEKEINKENNISSATQNSTEVSQLPNITDKDNRLLLPLDNANDKIVRATKIPILLSDPKILDENFKSQINVNVQAGLLEVHPTIQRNYKINIYNNKQSLNSIKATHNSTDQQKTKIFTKRSSVMKNLRTISTNNILNGNIQRCGVSRKLSTEKAAEENHTIPSTLIPQSQLSTVNRRFSSLKPKNTIRHVSSATITSSFVRPLRAFQMSTLIPNESLKSTRKTPATSHQHNFIIQKTFASRTISATVLPSPNLLTHQKNN